jgi:hypothetical protein
MYVIKNPLKTKKKMTPTPPPLLKILKSGKATIGT